MYSASGDITLVSSGAIYDAVSSDFAKIQANSLTLDAGTAADGQDSIGLNGQALHVNIVGGDLVAVGQVNINVDQTNGSLNVLDALSQTGNVTLGAGQNILSAGYLSDPTNPFSDVNAPTETGPANIIGNSITLSAGENSLGGIGTGVGADTIFIRSNYSNTNIATNPGTITAVANQNIYLTELTGDMYLYSVSDNGAVALITALSGSIWNGRADNDPIIVSGQAELVALNSIGASGYRNNNPLLTNRIVGSVHNIEASATTGNIYLWNIGALDVGHVTGMTARSRFMRRKARSRCRPRARWKSPRTFWRKAQSPSRPAPTSPATTTWTTISPSIPASRSSR